MPARPKLLLAFAFTAAFSAFYSIAPAEAANRFATSTARETVVYESIMTKSSSVLAKYPTGTRVVAELSWHEGWAIIHFQKPTGGYWFGWTELRNIWIPLPYRVDSPEPERKPVKETRFWVRAGMASAAISPTDATAAVGAPPFSSWALSPMGEAGYYFSRKLAVTMSGRYLFYTPQLTSPVASSLRIRSLAGGAGVHYELLEIWRTNLTLGGGIDLAYSAAGHSRGSAFVNTSGIISPAFWIKTSAHRSLIGGLGLQLDLGYREFKLTEIPLYPLARSDSQKVTTDIDLGGFFFAGSLRLSF